MDVKKNTRKKMSVFTQIRKHAKMSQGELARLLGVTNVTISRWETSQTEPALTLKQIKVLSVLLRGMGLHFSDLPDDPFSEIDLLSNNSPTDQKEKVLISSTKY